jgi:hypothetical protein
MTPAERGAAERARAGLPESIQDAAIIRAVVRIVRGASGSAASRTPNASIPAAVASVAGASRPAGGRVHPTPGRVAKASTSEPGPVVRVRDRSHSPSSATTAEARDATT